MTNSALVLAVKRGLHKYSPVVCESDTLVCSRRTETWKENGEWKKILPRSSKLMSRLRSPRLP